MNRLAHALLISAILAPAAAFGQTFTMLSPQPSLPSVANAVSASGRFVTGSSTDPASMSQLACVWSPSAQRSFLPVHGSSTPIYQGWAISDNGLIVAGESSGSALVWGPAGDAVLGDGAALGLTPDGSVSVGYLTGPDGHTTAFRRAATGQLTPLPPLPGHHDSVASGISRNGRFVVGLSADYTIPESIAVVWHDGTVTPLDQPFIYYLSSAVDVSDDGTIVVGSSGSLDGVSVAVRWSNGVANQTFVPSFGSASACSANGQITVGGFDGGAFVWDAAHGTRTIASVLSGAGVDLTGLHLTEARGLSADGNVVVGVGYAQDASTSFAWRATLGPGNPFCLADLNGDGNVNPDDLGDYITCYFTSPPCPRADFNGDNNVNPDDLGDFITTYFGPPC